MCNVADGIAIIAVKNNSNAHNKETQDVHTTSLVLFVEEHILSHFSSTTVATDATTNTNALSTHSFKQHLSTQLSAYMLPAHIFPVSSLPRTVSKKVDRQQLLSTYNSLFANRAVASTAATNNLSNANNNTNQTDGNTEIATEESYDDINSIMQVIYNTIAEVLPNMSLTISSSSTDYTANTHWYAQHTFTALGGDSMTAIEILFKLRAVINNPYNTHNTYRAVTVRFEDLMLLTISELAHTIHTQVRSINSGVTDQTSVNSDVDSIDTEPQTKRTKLDSTTLQTVTYSEILRSEITCSYSVGRASHSTALNSASSYTSTDTSTSTNAAAMIIRWKCPLLKCVDASPLVVVREYSNASSSVTVYIGSHAGDFTAIDGQTGQFMGGCACS